MWNKTFLLTISLIFIGAANATRCYRCTEGGLRGDVRNCGTTTECRYGCKITQVVSSNEVVVEQDCFELTFPYNSNTNNPSYNNQYPYSNGQGGIVFNPHNPNNRGYDTPTSSWDQNNRDTNGRNNGCSTYAAIQRFRSLFPYASGYSATCNTCDWDYCNTYNSGVGKEIKITLLIVSLFIVFYKNL